MIDNETKERALAWVARLNKKAAEQREDKAPARVVETRDGAVKIAMKILRPFEKFEERAYPDPLSPLYKELSKHGILRKFMDGKLELPPYLQELSGEPWTKGYGITKGVKQGDTCTLVEAENDLFEEVKEVMGSVMNSAPNLWKASDEAVAACISLAFNIGNTAFANSTVAKKIAVGDWEAAGNAFLMWNKGGKPLAVVPGLDKRRHQERALFLSVKA